MSDDAIIVTEKQYKDGARRLLKPLTDAGLTKDEGLCVLRLRLMTAARAFCKKAGGNEWHALIAAMAALQHGAHSWGEEL